MKKSLTVFHRIRTKDGHAKKRLTPRSAIRMKCLDCSAWSFQEVRLCPVTDCPMWPYRHGVGHPPEVVS